MKAIIQTFFLFLFFIQAGHSASIADNLAAVFNAKNSLRVAINNLGGSIGQSDALRNYVRGIEQMCGGAVATANLPVADNLSAAAAVAELQTAKNLIASALVARGVAISPIGPFAGYAAALAEKSCCSPGSWSATGLSDCSNCGTGYFCSGNNNRAACSYGFVTCPNENHSSESIPSSWTGMFNKPLTLAEVNAMGIPATNISQWRNLGCSRTNDYGADLDNPAAINAALGGIKGTVGPGIYLFTESNNHDGCKTICYNSNIAVFDRPVGYKAVHSTTGVTNVPYHIFVDTNNAVYSSYTIRFPVGGWGGYVKETNISGIESAPGVAVDSAELCVWELIY